MSSKDQETKKNRLVKKDGNWNQSKNRTKGVRTKRKWVQEHKLYEGSVKEGQGFAFQRKQRVKYEYNKLLRKERKTNPGSQSLYEDKFPENLKHLYLAEAQKLKSEAWENRLNRSKARMKGREGGGKGGEEESPAPLTQAAEADTDLGGGSEPVPGEDPNGPGAPEEESLPISNRMRKKMLRKTSYQKTREDFEAAKEKKRKKKEEYLKNKQQREEAIQRYKQKKMETYQKLNKKTKKGQPNLNLQMEYLLEKIQGGGK